MNALFEYQNYREYLRDYYAEQKASKKYFSYRYFAEKAGVNTPTFLLYIIDGKRNLTKSSIVKVSRAIGHSRDEADYFENLVFFNQAATIEEKTHFYSRLIEMRKPVDLQKVTVDRYEYYSKWYHSVIRELISFVDFKSDYARLGSMLIPAVTAREAKDSVNLLVRLGFVVPGENGKYEQTNSLIFSKPEAGNLFEIERFQIEMLNVARSSYDALQAKKRMSTSTTFSISTKTFDLFKLRIRELQQNLMEMAKIDPVQQQVFQMTINLFPVSKDTTDAV